MTIIIGPTERLSLPIRLRAMLRRAAKTFGRSGPDDAGTIILTGGRVSTAGSAARRLFGETARPGARAEALIARAGRVDPRYADRLRALIADGRACRFMIEVEGAVWEVEGAPDGRAARLSLRDASRETAALRAMQAERDEARREAEALRAALDAAPVPVRRRGADGAIVWRNRAAASAPPLGEAAPGDAGLRIGPFEIEAPGAASGGADRFARSVSETFEQLHIGIAVFDDARRLTLANPAAAELFGVDGDRLSRSPHLRTLLDGLREARRLPEQSDYPTWRATLFQTFDGPEAGAYEDVWELPDLRSIHVLGRPCDGGGVLFVFEDVTESMELQRWRSTAVEVRRATLEMLDEGVAVFGADGQIRIANPAFLDMWGLDERSRFGRLSGLADACAAKAEAGEVWSVIRTAVASVERRAPWRGRVRLVDGRALIARIAPMPDGSTLAVFTDVSDGDRVADALRDRAAALEAAGEIRAALANQISQQLRAPLNAVFGFADMLIEGRAGALDDRQAAYLRHIRSAAGSLRTGVETVADLASLPADEDALTMRPVALGPILQRATALVERRAAERGVAISASAQPSEITLPGYATRLRQMLFNMLSAAVNAGAPGDALRVGLDVDADAVEIWCAGASCATAGDDIAFSLARRVAEQHGGGLRVEPGADGPPRIVCRLSRKAVARAA